ncbi:MAG: hypothetical protein HY902_14050 [Deltaproteobacteria bacterium]|nr:hypothetical protein [Deltaproteobacteria bacterium]
MTAQGRGRSLPDRALVAPDDTPMWQTYLDLVGRHPLLMAFGQFALLGTAGEVLSARLRSGSAPLRLGPPRLLLKVLGWGALGMYIKFMFVTAAAGVPALVGYGALPAAWAEPGLPNALATSTLMNVMLGPAMVLLHRVIDNAIDRALGHPPLGWAGLDKALATLGWLWIPLHTLTFLQPKEVRIGMAAALSLVLGAVLGLAGRAKRPA